MKHCHAICLIMMLLLVSCGTTRKMPVKETWQQDSIRVEVRTETVYVPDTVYLEIPAQAAERTTADSTSHLENDYASSDARINPDGTLYHDLNTKPQLKPVMVDKQIERNDSIVYIDKEVKVPYPVEKELGVWQKFKLKYFNVLVIVLLALLVWTFRTPLLNLIRRFI